MGVGQCVCVSFSCAATAGPDLHLPCVTHRVILVGSLNVVVGSFDGSFALIS